MVRIAEWFGANPFFYYLVALAVLFAFVALVIVPRKETLDNKRFELGFLFVTAAVLYAWRWPVFFASHSLHPDEGIWAAGAIKVMADAVPWRGFDGTTSGPLTSYVLAFPALFGLRIDFFSTRVIALGLMVITMYALYYGLKWTHGARVARLSLLPPVVLLALTKEIDFLHCSSEHLPIALTTIGFAGAAYLAGGHGSTLSRLLVGMVAGLSIGSAGFAKLQVLPIAAAVLGLLAAAIWSLKGFSSSDAKLVSLVTVISLCFTPAAIVLSLWLTGEIENATTSYIKANVAYTSYQSTSIGLRFFLGSVISYTVFLYGSLTVVLVGLITIIGKQLTPRATWAAASSLLLLLSCVYAIYKPQKPFPHYLLFSIVPLSCCVATAMEFTRHGVLWRRQKMLMSFLYVALFLTPALGVAMMLPNPFLTHLDYNIKGRMSEPVRAIARYAPPGSRIVVWGWMPEYYVYTGTIMGTRDAQTGQQIARVPYLDYYQQRFMADIQAAVPLVFVDAAAPVSWRFWDRATHGYESFPALAAFVNQHYVLKEDLAGVRIFAIRDP